MRRMRLSLVAIVVLAVSVLMLAGCGRKGLINVNGEKIAKDEFYARLERVPVQTVKGGRQVTVPAGQYVVEQMVTERLLQQLAKDQSVAPTDAQIERKLKYLKRSSGGSFMTQLQQQGVSLAEWKRQMMLQQSVVNLITKDSTIPDADVKKSYDAQIAKGAPGFVRPEAARISVIIVKAEAKIQKAYKLLQDGQDFGTVALQLSEDRTTAPYQGAVGWLSMNMQIVPMPIRTAAFATGVGKYSQPLHVQDKADSAWVIVKVDQKRKASTENFSDVKDLIREQMAVAKASRAPFDKLLKEFIAKSNIVVNAERYKKIPEMMKKSAAVPADLQPGKMNASPASSTTTAPK